MVQMRMVALLLLLLLLAQCCQGNVDIILVHLMLLLLLLLLKLLEIVDGWSCVIWPMSEGTMSAILGTVALVVRFMDTNGRLVVAQVVAFLRIACVPVHKGTLVRVGTHARLFVVLLAVHVRIVVERAVAAAYGSSAPLVLEMPVEAGVGTMLCAFVLEKEGTLVNAETLQIRIVRRLLGCLLLSGCGYSRCRRRGGLCCSGLIRRGGGIVISIASGGIVGGARFGAAI